MTQKTLPELAKKMKDIDFTMFTTYSDGGEIAGRPMSNNGEVEYDGKSYYFAYEDSRVAKDVAANPKVMLAYQGKAGLLGKPPLMISIEARGQQVKDKTKFSEHWSKDLDRWFEQGVDTPGLVMLEVHAKRIHYWDGEDEGEITL